jgi:hypothetical protein
MFFLAPGQSMPSIARFHCMTIYVYAEPDEPHHYPHFHVRYNEYQASFLIHPPSLLAGSLPRRQLNLILAWAELHGEELEEN